MHWFMATSHSRGGPNCSLVKEADLDEHQAHSAVLATRLGGGGKCRPHPL